MKHTLYVCSFGFLVTCVLFFYNPGINCTAIAGNTNLIANGSLKDLHPVVKIDASQTSDPISRYIYGQFIEHLGRCIYGGIWAETLEDRKFYYPITADYSPWQTIEPLNDRWSGAGVPYKILGASPWQIVGPTDNLTMVKKNAYVGEHTPHIKLKGNPGGIVQKDLGLVKNKKYTGRVVIAGDPEAAPIEVSLIWGKGEKDRQTITIGKLSKEFAKVPFSFKAGASTDNGQLQIVGLGKGTFQIGTASIMPANNIKGFRRDTFELLKELNSPVYRWPGGNFVSGYNWKDGIGDPDKRPPRKNPAWKGIEHNDVGIDEFMVFCDILNTEPFIAVNTGLGTVEEVRDEVEYCNGSADTPMGSWRARNGNAEPYNVKWWAVGNEMYGNWQLGNMPLEDYVKKHNKVAKAMRSVDSSIQLVGVGAVGNWSKTMLTHCADHMEMVSEHFYHADKPTVLSHIRQIPDSIKNISDAHRGYRKTIESLRGKDIRIAMDEWNYWYGPNLYGELGVRYFMKDALGIAAGLHEYYRNSDIIFMANYAQTVNVIGCIKTSKTQSVFATTGLVLKLYRREFGVIPINVSVNHSVPDLDVAAAWTSDKKALTVAVVNPHEKTQQIQLELKEITLTGSGKSWIISGKDPMAYNEPGMPEKISIRDLDIDDFSGSLSAGPYSITLYKLNVK